MTRKNFSTAVKVARFKHCGGRCEFVSPTGLRCDELLKPGNFDVDHDIPDAMGGKPTFENARCLCIPCHRGIKTPADKGNIAKAVRREAKDLGIKQPKQQIQSRGFAPKPKREKLAFPERTHDAFGRPL